MSKEVASTAGTIYSILAVGTKITGDIVTDYDFRIDGDVEGDITCNGKLIVGPQSCIKGAVICVNAEVYGKIEGSLEVAEMLMLRKDSVVAGPLKTSTLIIEANASFNGSCQMSSKNAE